MKFSVNVDYLESTYTYEITTGDRETFTCKKVAGVSGDALLAPPEALMFILGDTPKPKVWGKPLTALYLELEKQILDYVQHRDE